LFLQDFSGKITKNEVQYQDLLQSIEQHRKTKTLTKNNIFMTTNDFIRTN